MIPTSNDVLMSIDLFLWQNIADCLRHQLLKWSLYSCQDGQAEVDWPLLIKPFRRLFDNLHPNAIPFFSRTVISLGQKLHKYFKEPTLVVCKSLNCLISLTFSSWKLWLLWPDLGQDLCLVGLGHGQGTLLYQVQFDVRLCLHNRS